MTNAIDKFPTPLIFKKILKDSLSGELVVVHEDSTRQLFFIDGRLEFANTTLENEHLGDMLLAAGKINKEQLRLALEVRSNVPTKIGEILVKLNDLNMRDVYDALVKHVINIAAATFPLKHGEWRFVKKIPSSPNIQNLQIKLPEVIKEGVSRLDDISYFKKKFYFRSPVTIALPDSISKILTPDEIEFYDELTFFDHTSVKRIMSQLQIAEPIFWRRIILFYLLNAADFVEFTLDDEEKNRKLEEINEMYQKIKSGRSDVYCLIDSEKVSAIDEIDERFKEYSDRFDPDKLDIAPDSTAMRRAREVFAEIQEAQNAAHLPGLDRDSEIKKHPGAIDDVKSERPQITDSAREYEPPPKGDFDLKTHPAAKPGAAKTDQVKQARDLFTRANHLHNQKKYFEASALLEQAAALDDTKANYFLLLGLCQSKMLATKKMAEKNLAKAAQMEPWNADPLFALGQLYKSENLLKKAREYFEKALEINMEHTLAGKAISEFGGLMGFKKKKLSIFGKKK